METIKEIGRGPFAGLVIMLSAVMAVMAPVLAAFVTHKLLIWRRRRLDRATLPARALARWWRGRRGLPRIGTAWLVSSRAPGKGHAWLVDDVSRSRVYFAIYRDGESPTDCCYQHDVWRREAEKHSIVKFATRGAWQVWLAAWEKTLPLFTTPADSAPATPLKQSDFQDRYRAPSTPESRAFFSPDAMAERAKLFADEPEDRDNVNDDFLCTPGHAIPYGSRPSEDARPVRLDAHRELEARVTRLEGAHFPQPLSWARCTLRCRYCGGGIGTTEYERGCHEYCESLDADRKKAQES